MPLKVDIFCKVVDNFGDIGICWRLAKQLQQAHDAEVRLWVDNWAVARKLIPELPEKAAPTKVLGSRICHWTHINDLSLDADVVLETFACELPPAYLAQMQNKQPLWLNIEHLSAESWVADFHGLPSPQANGIQKYVYFPGFDDKTGGLLRESNYCDQTTLLQPFDLPLHDKQALHVSLFAYPSAPMSALLDAMQASAQRTHCYIPQGSLVSTIAEHLGAEALPLGETKVSDTLFIHILPFLSQDAYDGLLQACDINFVRGEDSWVRAIWAGKPFVWQPYQQEEDVHIPKLDAFLDLFYADAADFQLIQTIHHAWSRNTVTSEDWRTYIANLASIQASTLAGQQQQLQQLDLASKLVAFCNARLLK